MNPHAPHHLDRRRSQTVIALLGATFALAPATSAAAAAPVRPVVRTGAASAVTYQGAVLTGTVYPRSQSTTYFFQYGLNARYGSQGPPVNVAAGSRGLGVRSSIGGLLSVTKYHYRLVAVNAAGTAAGADATFTTKAIPLSLAIGAVPSPVVFGASPQIIGTLSGTGAGGRPVTLQQNPYPFVTGFQNVGNPEVTLATGGFDFSPPAPAVTTQYRVVSTGAGRPGVVSPTVTEEVALAVTMHVKSRRIRHGRYSMRVSGVISPAEDGARVSLQRLVGSTWKFVSATNARTAAGGTSTYTKTVHRSHGGFFRVLVTPVEGAHVADTSQPALVHLG